MSNTLPEPNLEAQEGLIGCALLGAAGDIMTSGITSDSFTDAQCRQAWGIIETLVEIDEQINIVTVKGLSKHLTVEWLGSLEDMAPTASNWSYHVNLVKSAATSRALWELGNLTASAAAAGESPDETIANLESALLKLNGGSNDLQDAAKGGWRALCDLLAEAGTQGTTLGIKSGLEGIDSLYRGFRPGTLNVLAGRPGAGKSAFAVNMALNVAKSGGRVLVFTAEMLAREYTMRLAGVDSGEDIQDYLLTGRSSSMLKIASSVAACAKLPISIMDSASINSSQMRAYARKVAKTRLDLVIVDYLQLYKPPGKSYSRENEIGEVSTALKHLSQECEVPVLALAQMNRGIENRESEPRLSDLRESGRIEQDADTVAFLHWDSSESSLNYLLKKNRNGPVGACECQFTPYNQRFLSPMSGVRK